ncbi:MAG: response regulator [Mariprofundaceae bacterium]|nr:response regulator [Mariprofundaceae bacterium]
MSGFDLSNFLAAFFDEARDRLVSINRALVEFESETIDEEGLVALRRDAHTIKGSALMLGVVDLGAVAHLFEDAMEMLIQNPEFRVPKMTQFLYDLHDQLDERLEYVDTEVRLDDKILKKQYDALLQEVQSGDGATETVVETKPAEQYSMIGAEEAADWKQQQQDDLDDLDDLDDVDDVESIAPPDIDTMMPEGMFVEDSADDLLSIIPEITIPEITIPETIAPIESLSLDDKSDNEDGFDLSFDHDLTFTLDKQEDVVAIDIEELDDTFTLEGLDNVFEDESLEALLGDMDVPDDVFVYGEPEQTQVKAEKAAEQARLQAQEKAAEQARLQAQEKAAKQARLQAQEKAAEQARLQAQEKAAEQARLQAQEKAAEQARLQAQEKPAEQARLQAQEKPAEQAKLQAQEKAAKQAKEDASIRRKIEEKAAKQAQVKSRGKAIEEAKKKVATAEKIAQEKEIAKKAASSTRPHATPETSEQHGENKVDKFRPKGVGDASPLGRSSGQRKASGRFLRVDAARLEDLSSFVVELSTERSRNEEVETEFRELLHEFRDLRIQWRSVQRGIGEMDPKKQRPLMESMDRSFDRGMRKMSRFMENQRFSQLRGEMMLKELRDQVLSLMLRPLDNVFSTFPRSVRDVAVKLGKRVKLMIDGSTVEIDQGISEMLVEPLVHLLNNAVSHGVEMPEERKRLGKPPIAQVSIVARQSGSEIHIEVIDDGRGLDEELIKRTAVERGVTTQLEADQMASAEILEMIFRPGFSTKKNVSDVSGRGIGMNVVQDAVRRLTGSIRIDSELGKGTRFLLSLPVSIAVQHALMFRMANANFGMLTHLVEQIVPLSAQSIEKGPGDKDYIRYGQSMVALVDMRTMLADGDESEIAKEPYVIIAEHIEGFVGIVVDDVLDELEIVVRELDPYVKRYQPQGLMGTTIAADGSVLVLLEPYGIKEMGRTAPDQEIVIDIAEEEKMAFSVLLVEDSLIARQIEKGVFESIGFTVETAIDGLDGLDKLKKGTFDLIVTDLEMPRLDGFGFVRRIRNQPEYEELPIMVISTRESAEDRMRALEAGADAYMIKQQLQGDKILETVQSLVGETESV